MRKRILLFLAIFLLLGGSAIAYFGYVMVFAPNFKGEPVEFFVYENTEVSDIVEVLDSSLIDIQTFKEWASEQELNTHLKPGRYVFEEGMSNRVMINRLKGGLQSPARLQFHNVRDFYELAGELANDLAPDSAQFLAALQYDSIWEAHEISDKAVRWGYIVPNTYEVYWTSSAREVVGRLIEEHGKFWNSSRLEKAEALSLTPTEVASLASIVQGETYMSDEMPSVAGLYLNRLDKGMKLECDATCKFAWEQEHPEDRPVRRVLYKMLDLDSPYNTYMYEGLPPGPISIPEVEAIEAVLNADDNEYLFMMADPERVGYHLFAKTYRQHQRNVALYRASRQ